MQLRGSRHHDRDQRLQLANACTAAGTSERRRAAEARRRGVRQAIHTFGHAVYVICFLGCTAKRGPAAIYAGPPRCPSRTRAADEHLVSGYAQGDEGMSAALFDRRNSRLRRDRATGGSAAREGGHKDRDHCLLLLTSRAPNWRTERPVAHATRRYTQSRRPEAPRGS